MDPAIQETLTASRLTLPAAHDRLLRDIAYRSVGGVLRDTQDSFVRPGRSISTVKRYMRAICDWVEITPGKRRRLPDGGWYCPPTTYRVRSNAERLSVQNDPIDYPEESLIPLGTGSSTEAEAAVAKWEALLPPVKSGIEQEEENNARDPGGHPRENGREQEAAADDLGTGRGIPETSARSGVESGAAAPILRPVGSPPGWRRVGGSPADSGFAMAASGEGVGGPGLLIPRAPPAARHGRDAVQVDLLAARRKLFDSPRRAP